MTRIFFCQMRMFVFFFFWGREGIFISCLTLAKILRNFVRPEYYMLYIYNYILQDLFEFCAIEWSLLWTRKHLVKGEVFFKDSLNHIFCIFGEHFKMLEASDWLLIWVNQSEVSSKNFAKSQEYDLTSFFKEYLTFTNNIST